MGKDLGSGEDDLLSDSVPLERCVGKDFGNDEQSQADQGSGFHWGVAVAPGFRSAFAVWINDDVDICRAVVVQHQGAEPVRDVVVFPVEVVKQGIGAHLKCGAMPEPKPTVGDRVRFHFQCCLKQL